MIKRFLVAAVFPFLAMGSATQARELPDFTELVEKHGAAVVNISTTQTVKANQGAAPPGAEEDPFYDFFRRFGPPQPREYEARSLGSGFILSMDGYIMTNSHVVEAADDITVRLNDKREFKAKIIGADKRSDVALLKIEASNLPVVTIGDASKLKVGEWVLAIGSPFGFDNTVTAGIISAKGRSLPQENIVPFLQTDVAINPGNSGGPLFNMRGEVVGVNSMIYSRTGGFMGLSFAIPIDLATEVAQQLKSSGRVARGRIGVVIQEVTKELAESFGLPKASGALVTSVEKGGAAEKAGILASDVIVKFDGKDVTTSNDLPRIVAATKPGNKVPVQVWRKGAAKDLTLTVGETPDDRTKKPSPQTPKKTQLDNLGKLGLAVTELSAEQKKELNIPEGVFVEDARGTASKAGIRRGDVILAVNNQEISTAEQLDQALSLKDAPRTVALLIKRGDGSLYVPLRIVAN